MILWIMDYGYFVAHFNAGFNIQWVEKSRDSTSE